MKKEKYTFEDLLEIMAILRKECPWDREQTHQSIKECAIEEAYEVAEAIDSGSPGKMADELGDLLLQIVFHSQMGKEAGEFDIDDVANAICTKMIRRHPHVFAQEKAETSDEVLSSWEEIKKQEKGLESKQEILSNISRYLPALTRAYKIWDKLIKWKKTDENLASLCQKSQELTQKIAKKEDNLENILGELMFVNAGISRLCGISGEEALRKFLEKYIKTIEI